MSQTDQKVTMNDAGEFSYVFEMPEEPRRATVGRVADGSGKCLLGAAPVLTWTEYTPQPWKLYARVKLTRSASRGAPAARAFFAVDRGVLTMLRPGDLLHVAALPWLGISIIRNGCLLAAAGAVETLSRISLGVDVQIRFPGENLEERFFRQRHSGHCWLGGPPPIGEPFVEIVAAGKTQIMPWGRPTIGPYEVFVRSSVTSPSLLVSIQRLKACPETSAHTTAQLLDRDGYPIIDRKGASWERGGVRSRSASTTPEEAPEVAQMRSSPRVSEPRSNEREKADGIRPHGSE
jgi:hypothetical protein